MSIQTAWGLATLLGLAAPAASAQECRLALVLALDVSSSVDSLEHQLQREGLARALLDPEVVRAFLAGDPVALHAFEWAGPPVQMDLLPGWVVVESEADLFRIAALLSALPRGSPGVRNRSTGLGTALGYAARLLQDAPPCRAQTVDVAGDGASNAGIEPADAYARYPFESVTVNALVVGEADGRAEADSDEGQLVAWYEAEVLHGPGAFSILADGYADYERAMAAKLERELTPLLASPGPGALILAEEPID